MRVIAVCLTLSLIPGQTFAWIPVVDDIRTAAEDVANGVKHVVNEADKIRRDIQPIDYDARQGRVIVNTPAASFGFQGGQVNVTPGAPVNFVQNLPGQIQCQSMWHTLSIIGPTYPIPSHIYSQLRSVGVPDHLLQRVRWSTNWNATHGMPADSVQAMALDTVILFRYPGGVENVALWAHEIKHVEQYARLGVQAFCTQYTLNDFLRRDGPFESEANREEARVAQLLANRAHLQAPPQQYAYFQVTGAFLYADASGFLYPADPGTGRVIGPANGRVFFNGSAYTAVDGFGKHYPAFRVR